MIHRSTPKSILVAITVAALTVFVDGPSSMAAEQQQADDFGNIPSTGELVFAGAVVAVVVGTLVYLVATSSKSSKKGDDSEEPHDADSTGTSSACSPGFPCLQITRETRSHFRFEDRKQPFLVNISLAANGNGGRSSGYFDRVPDRSLIRVGLVFTL